MTRYIESIYELPEGFDFSIQHLAAIIDTDKEDDDTRQHEELAYDLGVVFALADALYWWCAENHGGMWSEAYAVMCSLGYKPGFSERSPVDEDGGCADMEREDVAEVYNQITLAMA